MGSYPPGPLVPSFASLLGLQPQSEWAARVNMAVAERFNGFLDALRVTERQRAEAGTKRDGVIGALNRRYYGHSSGQQNSIVIGSWGKGTEQRPPRDVDIVFVMPGQVQLRFFQRGGNIQSQLLQEVKGVLLETYPRTEIRADGPVVVVSFDQGHGVEVAPAFRNQDGSLSVCHTSEGGHYQRWHPFAEMADLNDSNGRSAGNTRRLIALAKRWQYHCNVPLKSFELEALAIEFLANYERPAQAVELFDYVIRDFLLFLRTKAHGSIWSPSSQRWHFLGDDWLSGAESASRRATLASELEVAERHFAAGEQWQMIFGPELQ